MMGKMGWRGLGITLFLGLFGCDEPSPAPVSASDGATDVALAVDAARDGGVSPVDAVPIDSTTPAQARLFSVPETASFSMDGLTHEVHVVRTEFDVPHIFAQNALDLSRVHGFVMARDRFWMMDLGRRLGRGTLSELFGDLVLGTDITSRARGYALVGERVYTHLPPERRATIDAFAAGVNDYIAAVADGSLPPPSELELFYGLLGATSAAELMAPFSGADIAAFSAVVIDRSACARRELENSAAVTILEGRGDPRAEAILEDLVLALMPLSPVTTIADAVPPGRQSKASRTADGPRLQGQRTAPIDMLSTLSRRLRRGPGTTQTMAGSNAWAVAPAGTVDGATLVAGDGHLDLTVPPYFHQAALDTGVLGGPDWHVRGNFMAGLPPLGVGTNGHVAWSFTCFYSDTIDYFHEELRLGADGLPDASRFADDWQPLTRHEETYQAREIAAFARPQRTAVEPLFVLFDGRRLLSLEGRPAEAGENGVDLGDGPVIPGDTDGDGVVSGISVDATYFDVEGALGAYYDIAEARSLVELRAAHRRLMVFGSHFVAGDKDGHIMASGYHAAPCRRQLARSADGLSYGPGANPRLLLDGTQYGGFTIGLEDDGTIDESNEDQASCVVPYAEFPQALDPPTHYLVSANNDPAGSSLDGSLANDTHYVGGPWAPALRAGRIDALVSAAVSEGRADIATMAAIQADNRSATGVLWSPHLLAALDGARARLPDPGGSPSEIRIAALYGAHTEGFEAVAQRMRQWSEDGFRTPSGVATFYHQPTEAEIESSIATMIFHAWTAHLMGRLFDDENLPSAQNVDGVRSRTRLVTRMFTGRGPMNSAGLASWDALRGESLFFDDLNTEVVETSDEMILLALADALALLESPPTEAGQGGFGTSEMTQWRWGLRHMVIYDSILAPFVEGVEGIGGLFAQFGISPQAVPLTEESLPPGDPRAVLPGFPRGGDHFSVDLAEPGYRPTQYDYRAGPVKRMVIALHPDGRVEGQNIVPGGQSGLMDSPHFADQLRSWLGNRAAPIRFHLDEIVEGAVGREVYRSP